jgi:hypothetical protein
VVTEQGRIGCADRAFLPSASSPTVSTVPASIPCAARWGIEGHWHNPSTREAGHIISYGANTHGDGPEGYVCKTIGTSDANARLIAAAPDLLEGLEELRDLMEAVRSGDYTPDSFTVQPADRAIAKAKGGA